MKLFTDVYNSSYGPAFTNCQNEWNMHGDGLVEENIPFPIFFLRETSDRDTFIKVTFFLSVFMYILFKKICFMYITRVSKTDVSSEYFAYT